MSGRRIVDISRLFRATRGIALRHFSLRSQQFTLYRHTSSLWKIFLSTRVSTTTRERWSSPPTSNDKSSFSSSAERQLLEDDAIPKPVNVSAFGGSKEQKDGLDQDHFYERSIANSTSDPVPDSEIVVKQKQATQDPLPDGSIPSPPHNQHGSPGALGAESSMQIPEQPSSAEMFQAEGERRSQRQAEEQIPAHEAEPPTEASLATRGAAHDSSEIQVDQERDVYYSPSSESRPVLSSLPRVKLPKATGDVQEGDVTEDGMQQDVFYASRPARQGHAVPDAQAVPEQPEPSEEMYSELFHSPKIARMMQGQNRNIELQRPNDATPSVNKPSIAVDRETFSSRNRSSSGDNTNNSEEDSAKLAADIANDIESPGPMPASNRPRRI